MTLYHQLGCQLKSLWANGTGNKAQDGAEEPTEAASEPESPQVPAPPPAHYFQEHDTPFKWHSRGENVWSSHKTADRKWCREK